MKVLSVIGTRPEAVKMACVVRALEATPGVESRVVVSAQHRHMLDQILALWRIVPDYDLDLMRPRQTPSDITIGVLRGLVEVFEAERPDWVLVQGDTSTAMAASLAAFYEHIPVGHVEAGLRTYDNGHPYPEEANRRITAVLAKLHFAPTAWAADNLFREGVSRDTVIITGNTVIDAVREVEKLSFDPIAFGLPDFDLTTKRLILVTAHRRENFGRGIVDICLALRTLVSTEPDVHLVMPVHPNPNVHEPVHRLLGGLDRVTLLPPLDYQPLLWVLRQCAFLLTDSGGLQEEATAVGKPVLVLRESTERPEGVEAGTAQLVGSDPDLILSWARRLLHEPDTYEAMARATNPYGDGHASERIVAALLPRQVVDLRDLEESLNLPVIERADR